MKVSDKLKDFFFLSFRLWPLLGALVSAGVIEQCGVLKDNLTAFK